MSFSKYIDKSCTQNNLKNFFQSYVIIQNKINYKSVSFLNSSTSVFYNHTIVNKFYFFLVFFKNINIVVYNNNLNQTYKLCTFFFEKNVFTTLFFENTVLNNLNKQEYNFITNSNSIKLPTINVKKSFFKKFKKKFSKFDNFPWKLKNFLTKKLVRMKQKVYYFNKIFCKSTQNNRTLNEYFYFLKKYFFKKLIIKTNSTNKKILFQAIVDYSFFSYDFSYNYTKKTTNKTIKTIPIKTSTLFLNTTFFNSQQYKIRQYTHIYKKFNSEKNSLFNFTCDTNFIKKNTVQKTVKLTTTNLTYQNNQTFLFKNMFFKHFIFNSNSFNLLNIILHSHLISNSTNRINNYTNYTPILSLDHFLQNSIFKKFKENTQPTFYKYLYHYMITYLENFFKKKFFLKMKTRLNILENSNIELTNIFSRHRNYQSKVGRGFFFLKC